MSDDLRYLVTDLQNRVSELTTEVQNLQWFRAEVRNAVMGDTSPTRTAQQRVEEAVRMEDARILRLRKAPK